MKKTRLGISTSLLAALAYFTAAFGGYPATLLVCGYILLFEKDGKLRKSAVKALVLMVLFTAVLSFTSIFGTSTVSISSMVSPINAGSATIYTLVVLILSVLPKLVLSVLGVLALFEKDKNVQDPNENEQ